MIRTQVQLTEEQFEKLKNLAEHKKVSMAELIRQGVDRVLNSSVSLDDEERRRRALDIAGRFHSGKHDVSAEHDKYLSEAMGG
ncbi:MAG: ribbon-helix-helix domain-containing protein [Actinobacteria bacterium]|nr:ribbon-helix-helix domain-containing protein [Actinomycetota bacterium]